MKKKNVIPFPSDKYYPPRITFFRLQLTNNDIFKILSAQSYDKMKKFIIFHQNLLVYHLQSIPCKQIDSPLQIKSSRKIIPSKAQPNKNILSSSQPHVHFHPINLFKPAHPKKTFALAERSPLLTRGKHLYGSPSCASRGLAGGILWRCTPCDIKTPFISRL